MDNNKKPSEPAEEERWALKEVNTMKNPLAIQILALSIQILALVVILLQQLEHKGETCYNAVNRKC